MDASQAVLGSGAVAAYLFSVRILATAAIVTAAGALMARWEGGAHQATLTRINSRIFIPCLVFASMNRSPLTISEAVFMATGSLFFAVASYPLAKWWAARDTEAGASDYLPMLFGSTGSLLLPLSFLLFGSQGIAKATFFHLTNLLLLYTWGMRCSGQPSKLSVFLRNPTLHAAILALLLKLFELELPQQIQELLWLVEKGIVLMAAGALPLLLMNHGYALYCLRAGGAAFWSAAALFRALWLPFVALLLIFGVRATGMSTLDKGYDLMAYLDLRTSEAILLLASALPCTISLSSLPEMARPSRRTGSLILSSSLLSIFVFTILVLLLNRYIFNG